jgi:hypothetical protein
MQETRQQTNPISALIRRAVAFVRADPDAPGVVSSTIARKLEERRADAEREELLRRSGTLRATAADPSDVSPRQRLVAIVAACAFSALIVAIALYQAAIHNARCLS